MNSIKRIMAALLVGGAGFGLFVACGPTNNGDGADCTFDADCADTEACEGGVCVATCESDTDCLDGEVCDVGQNTDKMVCVASDTSNTTNNTTGNNTTNNTTGTNNMPQVYYFAQILDTSTSTESCDVADPGSDIMAVALEDSDLNTLGWGLVEADAIEFEGNDFVGTDHLNGDAVSLNADNCVDDFASENVTALGCGGWIAVRFYDADDNIIPLDATADQQIRVYEYGGQCSTGSTTDTYEIYICTDTEAVAGGTATSCTIDLATDASQETSAPVSF